MSLAMKISRPSCGLIDGEKRAPPPPTPRDCHLPRAAPPPWPRRFSVPSAPIDDERRALPSAAGSPSAASSAQPAASSAAPRASELVTRLTHATPRTSILMLPLRCEDPGIHQTRVRNLTHGLLALAVRRGAQDATWASTAQDLDGGNRGDRRDRARRAQRCPRRMYVVALAVMLRARSGHVRAGADSTGPREGTAGPARERSPPGQAGDSGEAARGGGAGPRQEHASLR